MIFGTRISIEMHYARLVNINQLTIQVLSLPTDRSHCHAIKNKFEAIQWKRPRA